MSASTIAVTLARRSARLVPVEQYAEQPLIHLARPVSLVGSADYAHVRLFSRTVSRAHAVILNADGRVYIRDLASRTGVRVNGQAIREANLIDGDEVRIGRFVLRFEADEPESFRRPTNLAPPAELVVNGLDRFAVNDTVVLIGTRPGADVRLSEIDCADSHALIFSLGGRRLLRDLKTPTQTFVNDRPVHQTELRPGQVIRIGRTTLEYVLSALAVRPVAADSPVPDAEDSDRTTGVPPVPEAIETPSDLPIPPPEENEEAAHVQEADHADRSTGVPPVPEAIETPSDLPILPPEENEEAAPDFAEPQQELSLTWGESAAALEAAFDLSPPSGEGEATSASADLPQPVDEPLEQPQPPAHEPNPELRQPDIPDDSASSPDEPAHTHEPFDILRALDPDDRPAELPAPAADATDSSPPGGASVGVWEAEELPVLEQSAATAPQPDATAPQAEVLPELPDAAADQGLASPSDFGAPDASAEQDDRRAATEDPSPENAPKPPPVLARTQPPSLPPRGQVSWGLLAGAVLREQQEPAAPTYHEPPPGPSPEPPPHPRAAKGRGRWMLRIMLLILALLTAAAIYLVVTNRLDLRTFTIR